MTAPERAVSRPDPQTPIPTSTLTFSPTSTPRPTPTRTPTPTPSLQRQRLDASELSELREFAVGLINQDRADHGLPPVALGSNPAAQLHAEDMLAHDYLGHWWVDGSKPYMVYTMTGGRSYVAENAAISGWTEQRWQDQRCDSVMVTCQITEPRLAIWNHQRGMMYDDAHANWGHRDNILRETHRSVNLGIAWNGRLTTFVQHFEGGDAAADEAPSLSENGTLSLSLSKLVSNLEVGDVVVIYYDPPPTPKTPAQIQTLHSYCTGGGFTTTCPDPIARVLPPLPQGYFYTDIAPNEIVADFWDETADAFSFSANMGTLLQRPGIYTVGVWRDTGGRLLTDLLLELSVVQP